MKVQVASCILVSPSPGGETPRFEAIRESVAAVRPGARRGHDVLRHATVECHPHELVDGARCARCGHLLNAVPSRDGRSVTVRCVFFESDPVTTLMTRAVDVVSCDASETLAVAAARMLDRDVEQLVVRSGEAGVAGVLTARAVEPRPREGDERAGDRMVPLPVVPRSMTLGGLATALRAEELDFVAVIDGDELVGVITRGDLRRAGIPGL
jgi:CBS domain-containing protein